MKCLICEEDFIDARRLSNHLKKIHNMNSKDYYDKYLSNNELAGKCVVCGKPTKFYNITIGYYERCSRACANKSINHIEAVKNTKLIKYNNAGYNNPDKISEVLSSRTKEEKEQTKIKVRQTKKIRYNDETYNNQKKRLNTLIQRHSYTSSKNEDYCHDKLKSIYPNVVRQYSDDRYPFACDFYIPEKDLFIELHFSWLHGFHKFDKNNIEDQQRLAKLQNKSSTSFYYLKAIKVWTESDIKKYDYATNNNLNYLVFYTLNDFNLWFSNHLQQCL